MTASLRSALNQELRHIITRHLEDVSEYIAVKAVVDDYVPDRLLAHLEQLDAICKTSAKQASAELYREAVICRETLEVFFHRMNQGMDPDFQAMRIGQIWLQANAWCDEAGRQFQLSIDEVWDLINPIKPDHLRELGHGLYEARWWKPVPMMDVELLHYTDGVTVEGVPFEPANLPNGLAVRFWVTSAAL